MAVQNYLSRCPIDISEQRNEISALQKAGKTISLVNYKNDLYGIIAVSDDIKESSLHAIAKLKELDLNVTMITGDNYQTAQSHRRQGRHHRY